MSTGAEYEFEARNRDVNQKDEDGVTPLIHAVLKGDAEQAATLVERGADIDLKGNCAPGSEEATPLIWASKLGYAAVVDLLLSRGALVDEKDYYGMTALMRAVMGCHYEVISLLLERGADVNVPAMSGESALMMAEEKNGLHAGAIIELFEESRPRG